MATINFLAGKIVSLKDDGTVNAGGKVTFYVADGTFSTPIATYSDKALTTPNSPTIILDSAGRAKAYFSSNADVRYLTSADVLIYSERDVSPQNVKTVYSKSASFAIDATYGDSVIEITAALTATLASAATLGAGFSFTIINTAAVTSTLARANAGDTINGTAANITIQANSSIEVTVNSGATGFLVDTIGVFPITVANGGTGSTTAATARTALDVPGLAVANIFTGNQTISSNGPQYLFTEADAAADNKSWKLLITAEDLYLRVINDADSTATDILRVERTGITIDKVAIGGTTIDLAGGQLKFPATQAPSSNVNTLDDYEEGLWNPSVGGTATYGGGNGGNYIKIGKLVKVSGTLAINTIGTGSTWIISGLPFVNEATLHNGGAVHNYTSLATAVVTLCAQIPSGGSSLQIYGNTAAQTSMTGSLNLFGNSTTIYFSASYFI